MRLVDDDRETAVAVLAADVVEDEREFLDRGDDDLLAALDKAAGSVLIWTPRGRRICYLAQNASRLQLVHDRL